MEVSFPLLSPTLHAFCRLSGRGVLPFGYRLSYSLLRILPLLCKWVLCHLLEALLVFAGIFHFGPVRRLLIPVF